ncbi:MAG: flagellar biosynthesis protein FliA [Oscillospiraceae bacterium]|nr:flagellar biosynthesis protein FliA [Oscillospiraceae bacterium]
MFLRLFSNIFSRLLWFALRIEDKSSFPKPLSPSEEERLFKAFSEGDTAARDSLILHNLRLVAHIVKKYYVTADEQEELISIGTVGLIKAVNSFDPSKGNRFATFGARCIENAIST